MLRPLDPEALAPEELEMLAEVVALAQAGTLLGEGSLADTQVLPFQDHHWQLLFC
jgi:hypothetical protein